MKIITHEMINNLNLDSCLWYEWVEDALKKKHLCKMPPKTSLHFGSSYFNTMPSILPIVDAMGVKTVNRYVGREPSLESQLMLFRYSTGECLALMDANMITAMRTGAVAVHAMETFAIKDFSEVGIMGFGNIGIACMDVLLAHYKGRNMKIKLLRYKDHADKVIDKYSADNKMVDFQIVDSVEEIICNSDVIISCITYTEELLGRDEWFKEGCLVIPVHLRGFQNCDLFFDKVYGDDRNQVSGFQYFDRFRQFAETSEVLRSEKPGRENDLERILSYNVGMALHDVYAASQIYEFFENVESIDTIGPQERYWL